MRTCISCGRELAEEAIYCPICGTKQPSEDTEKNIVSEVSSNEVDVEHEANDEVSVKNPEREVDDEVSVENSEREIDDELKKPSVQVTDSTRDADSKDNVSKISHSMNASSENNGAQQKAANSIPFSQSVLQKLKSINKKAILMVVICTILLIFASVYGSRSRRTIDLKKYTKVTFDGYDGYGTASVSIDWNAIQRDYADKIQYRKKAAEALGGWSTLVPPIDALQLLVNCSLDKRSDLSNGDKITLAYTVDQNYSQVMNCILKYGENTIKVDSLDEIQEVDPFTYLSADFSGVDGFGRVEVIYNGPVFSIYDFSVDKSYDLSNGDEVLISYIETDDYYARTAGVRPSVTEKTYTVFGLGHYMNSIEELPQSDKDTIKEYALSQVKTYVEGWATETSVDSIEALGTYLQVEKEKVNNTHNYYGNVFRIKGHIKPEGVETAKEYVNYVSVEIGNIVIGIDGTASYSYDTCTLSQNQYRVDVQYGSKSYEYYSYYFRGYDSLEELQKAHVLSSTDKYTYEWNVKE